MKTIIQLIPKTATGRRSQRKMTVEYITIHSTGNPASTAQNEADNVCNNSPEKQVSFHWVADEDNIISTLPDNEVGWHAGDGTGAGNYKSIGVEICESGDRKQTLLNAVELVKSLMSLHKIDIDHVVQHNHWSGKDCPRILRDTALIKNGMDWNWFINQLKGAGSTMTVEEAKKIVKEKAGLSDDTIQYLMFYEYDDELIVKLAKAMM